MHVDVGSEKVVGLLHLDAGLAIVIGEGHAECVDLGVGQRRLAVGHVGIVNVEQEVHERAIVEDLPKVAGVSCSDWFHFWTSHN